VLAGITTAEAAAAVIAFILGEQVVHGVFARQGFVDLT
jgi:hypothetical protein